MPRTNSLKPVIESYHWIVCNCCKKKARVPVSRSWLCDTCFTGECTHEQAPCLTDNEQEQLNNWLSQRFLLHFRRKPM